MSNVSIKRGGKEPIAVWRRGRWTSMAHSMGEIDRDGATTTRCGHYVAIHNDGVDALVYTQITAELFITTGCGTCRNALVRELHDELAATNPDAKVKLRALLAKLDWQDRETGK